MDSEGRSKATDDDQTNTNTQVKVHFAFTCTHALINHGICSSPAAVRWRNGLPSASSSWFDPRQGRWLNMSTYRLTRARSSGIKAVGKAVWEVFFCFIYLMRLFCILFTRPIGIDMHSM